MTFTINGDDIQFEIIYKRMKYLRMRMRSDGIIVISAPIGINGKEIEAFVKKSEEWLTSTRKRMKNLAMYDLADNEIFYRGLVWKNAIKTGLGNHVIVNGSAQILSSTTPLTGKRLLKWYKTQAKFYFPARLQQLADEHGFEYKSATVREASSKWGSWRTDGVITINSKLILAPASACDAILLHELAHTKHGDHSKNFWQLLYTICPEWDSVTKWLKTYHYFMETLWRSDN